MMSSATWALGPKPQPADHRAVVDKLLSGLMTFAVIEC